MFIAHAMLKIVVFTPAGTFGFFESLGLPGVFAYATIAAELLGGIALVLGVATRWVSLALVPVLAGAPLMVHWNAGWLFSNAGGGWEYPAFLVAASLAQALLGDGPYALRLPAIARVAGVRAVAWEAAFRPMRGRACGHARPLSRCVRGRTGRAPVELIDWQQRSIEGLAPTGAPSHGPAQVWKE